MTLPSFSILVGLSNNRIVHAKVVSHLRTSSNGWRRVRQVMAEVTRAGGGGRGEWATAAAILGGAAAAGRCDEGKRCADHIAALTSITLRSMAEGGQWMRAVELFGSAVQLPAEVRGHGMVHAALLRGIVWAGEMGLRFSAGSRPSHPQSIPGESQAF